MGYDVPMRLALALTAALAIGCVSPEEPSISREVAFLVGEPGSLADAAEARLVRRGREAILHLEVGLYDADAAGRRRVIRVLAAIGDGEAAPILAHRAAHDPDPEVRAAARAALESL